MKKIIIMKKIISLLLVVSVLLSVFSIVGLTASAEYDVETGEFCEGIEYTYNAQTNYLTISGTGDLDSRYSDYVEIGDMFPEVESVVINPGITCIGDYMFADCRKLVSITLPDTVKEIKEGAFSNCTSLKEITIPKGVSKLAVDAFSNCYQVEKLVVDSKNPVYDSRNNCNAVIEKASNTLLIACKSTVIPNTVVTIGSDAFNLSTEWDNPLIPGSVATIKRNAFYRLSNRLFYVQKGVKLIESFAFPDIKYLYYYGSTADWQKITIKKNPVYDGWEGIYFIIDYNQNEAQSAAIHFNYNPKLAHGLSREFEVKATGNTLGYTAKKCKCGALVKSYYTNPLGVKVGLKCKARAATAQTLQWNNCGKVAGYQVQVSEKGGKDWDKTYNIKTNYFTVKGLVAGNIYKFRVRFYVKADNGVNYFSPWSLVLTSPTLPSGTAITKLTPAKRAFVAQWKASTGVNGYQIQYATNKKFTGAKAITVKNAKTLKAVAKNLYANKAYAVRIRTFKVINKAIYFSSWSKAVIVKTK